jgi:predicted TIM-barrel fold metal-dependent hydrolase
MRAGRALTGVLIENCHAHIGSSYNHPTDRSDAESLVQGMDRLGIDRACVSSSLALGPDVRTGNNDVLRAIDQFPDRIVGAAVINPRYPDEIDGELYRMFECQGVRMIKVHPESHAYPIDGAAYAPAWTFAEKRRIPILTHSWGEGRGYDHPLQAERVARAHPDMPLILGHSAGTPNGIEASIDAAKRMPNLFLDTGTSLVFRGAIETMVREVGASRILFGTDGTYLADPPQLGKVIFARISDDDKVAILGQNLRRLLDGVLTPSMHAD